MKRLILFSAFFFSFYFLNSQCGLLPELRPNCDINDPDPILCCACVQTGSQGMFFDLGEDDPIGYLNWTTRPTLCSAAEFQYRICYMGWDPSNLCWGNLPLDNVTFEVKVPRPAVLHTSSHNFTPNGIVTENGVDYNVYLFDLTIDKYSTGLNEEELDCIDVNVTFKDTVARQGLEIRADLYTDPDARISAPAIQAFNGRQGDNVVVKDGAVVRLSSIATYSGVGTSKGQLVVPGLSQIRSQAGVVIDGTLLVDVDYWFKNTKLIFTPGSKLVIQDNASLTIFTSSDVGAAPARLVGCQSMWEGVTVEGGSTLNFDKVLIRDAHRAVQTEEGSFFGASESRFIHNYIGVQGEGGQINIGQGCKFDGAGTLKASYSGQPYMPANVSMTGILSNAGNFNISGDHTINAGFYGNGLVEFTNMPYGIVATSGVVNCSNSEFYALDGSISPYGPNSVGIRLTRNPDVLGAPPIVTVSGIEDGRPSFHDIKRGIHSSHGVLRAQSNKMEDIEIGVWVDRNFYRQRIMDNDISASAYGIRALGNFGMGTEIHDNTIEISNPVGWTDRPSCVSSMGNRGLWDYEGNLFQIEEGLSGLDLVDCNVQRAINNTSVLPDNRATDGFFNAGNSSLVLRCNTATGGASSTGHNSRGFVSSLNKGPVVRCNESIGGMNRGFQYDQANLGADRFSGNSPGGNTGLFVSDGAVMDLQNHQGNCWPGNGAIGARNENTKPEAVEASQFGVDQKEMSCFLPAWYAVGGGDWFDDEGDDEASFVCSSSSTCPNGVGSEVDPCQSPVYSKLVDNPVAWSYDSPSEQWNLEFQIYGLLREGDCQQYTLELTAFMATANAGELAALYNVEQDIHDLLDLNLYNGVIAQSDNILAVIDQLNVLYNDLQENAVSISNLESTLASEQVQLENQSALLNDDFLTSVADLDMVNGAINTNTSNGLRLQLVNDLYFDLLAGTPLSSADVTYLDGVASLCPRTGGLATYRARTIMAVMGVPYYADDCTGAQPLIQKESKEKILSGEKIDILETTIWPNPSKGYIQVSISGADQAHLRVTNIHGAELLSQSLLDKTTQIDVSSLGSGFYFFEIRDELGNIKIEKVCIH